MSLRCKGCGHRFPDEGFLSRHDCEKTQVFDEEYEAEEGMGGAFREMRGEVLGTDNPDPRDIGVYTDRRSRQAGMN